jgi:hypothetical protein
MHQPTAQAVGQASAAVHPEEIKGSVDLRVGNSVSLKPSFGCARQSASKC